MKLRKNDKPDMGLSPEQKTQIELARLEVAKVKAQNSLSESYRCHVHLSIVWGIVIVIAVAAIASSISLYNVHVSKLEHEKVLKGFVKESIIGHSYPQWRKPAYNNSDK